MTHVNTGWFGHAKPGDWYAAYHEDWSERHPGAWQRGELASGSFYAGNV